MLALLQESPGYVTAEKLMEELQVSRRTVYYDMEKINEWLRGNGLEPVEYVRRAGFRLTESCRAGLPELAARVRPYEYVWSPKERKAWMALLLFARSEPVHVQDMADFLQVSRVTALQDMKRLKEELAAFRLSVTADRKAGYAAAGEEGDKRKALAHYLSQLLTPANWKRFTEQVQGAVRSSLADRPFPLPDEAQSAELHRLVAACERSLGMEFTDEMVFTLTSRLPLFAARLRQGKTVKLDEDEKATLRRMPEYQGAKRLAAGLGELYRVEFPEDEVCYLTMHLLGARLNRLGEPDTEGEAESRDERRDRRHAEGQDERDEHNRREAPESRNKPGDAFPSNGETAALRELTARLVDRFEQLACLFFEKRAELEEQLFLHLKPAYYRIKYGLEVEHPMLDTMRTKYRDVFELTRKAVQPLEEKLGKPVSDDETAFFAMHFGGWMRRQNAVPVRRRRAAIVCVNGVSTSRMLRIQLEALFPYLDIVAVLSLREYEKFRRPVDVLFSTVQLQRADAPVFVVNAVLSDRDKAQLLHEVNRRLEAGGGPADMHSPPVAGMIELIKRYAVVTDEAGLADALSGYWAAAKANKPDYAEPGKPSLADALPASRIRIAEAPPDDWRRAIRMAAEPLVEEGLVELRYVEAMIGKVNKLGPYIVVAPEVAIAHAKPEEGVHGTGMSLLVVPEGVAFSPEPKHRVRALFALASDDGESHLRALSELTILLRKEENRTALTRPESAASLQTLIERSADTATNRERGDSA
ncbi:BglG family transcription antiterminator [Paenibacillus flagellatus]|uniref:Transcription antiterminator BglG n=1 Tax=Paenibacillus flagellatus TaxID=2211139 RepID=A0A2V5JXI9_9BACL|nr:BglG family transcription antiterminator [Paenibacillus flagellatus]PYI51498.1 transcription antiterminator BglG [Paenibacillus flagellatus]